MSILSEPSEFEHISAFPFERTLENIVGLIQASGMRLFATIDHAANARDVGLAMPPTTVLIYGKAEGGTPIMIASPHSALDLPLRVLVRENANGQTIVFFHPVTPMLKAWGVPTDLAARLEPAQQLLLTAIQQ